MDVVPDANTLIYLAKADLLHTLEIFNVEIGEEIYNEAVEKGKENNKSDAYILEKEVTDNYDVKEINNKELGREKEYFQGVGEAEAYLLAKGSNKLVITSDQRALKKIRRRGLKVIRTDTMMLMLYEDDEISKEELRENLTDLKSVGGTTEDRINIILNQT